MVTAYSVLETGLLLGVLQPNFVIDGYQSSYYTAVLFGQLLLIPGLAALFSWVTYGSNGWGRRALRIVAGVALGVIVSILAIIGFALLLEWIDTADFGFGTPSWISSTISILLFITFLVGIVWILWIGFKRSGKKSVELESARWLVERRSGISASDLRWRNRSIRWASWIPVLIVLLIFLFLPESEHLLSFLRHSHEVKLGDYRVRVPAGWLTCAIWTYKENGRSGMSGIIGIEMRKELGTYVHGPLAISEWMIDREPPESATKNPWRAETPTERRVIPLQNGSVVCLEYNTPYGRNPSGVRVECSGREGLHASIFGEQRHVPEFYRALSQITIAGK